MVRSLLEQLGARHTLRLVIIDGGITPGNRRRLEDSWRDTVAWPRTTVQFVAPQFGGAHSLPVWGRMSVLTYARLCLADYLPDTCRRALVLDSDLLILTDVSHLAALPLDGATVAATRDPYIPLVSSPSGISAYRRLHFAPDEPYFNAGIMLVDVERWRRNRVAEQAFAFIEKEGSTLNQFDQDSLNVVLRGAWKELDSTWQAHPRLPNSLGHPVPDDAKILHFSGRLKPWSYHSSAPEDRLFFETLDRTAWREWRPPVTLEGLALLAYDSCVRRAVYPLERRFLAWWQLHGRRTAVRQSRLKDAERALRSSSSSR